MASCHMTSFHFLSHDTHHFLSHTYYIVLSYKQFAGGISTELLPNESRRVYFEGSDPARPLMRVAQQLDDDGRVRSTYSWERGDPLHVNTSDIREGSTHIPTPFKRLAVLHLTQTSSGTLHLTAWKL